MDLFGDGPGPPPTEAAQAAQATDATKTPSYWPNSWPMKGAALDGADLQLVPLIPSHALQFTRIMELSWNIDMFPVVYGEAYKDANQLIRLFSLQQDPSVFGGAYTILLKGPSALAYGWIVIKPFSDRKDDGLISTVIFYDAHEAAHRNCEVVWLICKHALDTLGYSAMDMRNGKRSDDLPLSTGLGLSLLGILRRQVHVRERSRFSEYHLLEKEAWPLMREALDAWFGQAAHGKT
jgi:hypothetical protein